MQPACSVHIGSLLSVDPSGPYTALDMGGGGGGGGNAVVPDFFPSSRFVALTQW